MGKLTDNQFLFGFEGRINRAKYWYAVLASVVFCIVFMAIEASVIGAIFGATVRSIDVNFLGAFGSPLSLPFSARFDNVAPETSALVTVIFYIVATPIAVIGICFIAATTIKRLHDRDLSGWWSIVFLIAPGLLSNLVDRIGHASYLASAFTLPLAVAAFCLKIWGTLELMFFSGTSGRNRFGPDPLAPAEPQPRWDQQSELTFVPPSAGPPPGPHVMRGT
jgi:uncharacterized membrane protein YhaH (DUF805 family)